MSNVKTLGLTGIADKKTRSHKTADDNSHLLELVEMGYSALDIAVETGYSVTAIHAYLRGSIPVPYQTVIQAKYLKGLKQGDVNVYMVKVPQEKIKDFEYLISYNKLEAYPIGSVS